MDQRYLGPFVGEVTERSAKFWLHDSVVASATAGSGVSRSIRFGLHLDRPDAPEVQSRIMHLTPENLGSGTVTFEGLEPDACYYYRLRDESGTPLELDGLSPEDLRVRTFPADERLRRFDFLLMSCHDPTQGTEDGEEGFGVWSAISRIREHNDIRFALLAGDQVYGDHVQEKALAERDPRKRIELYLGIYRKLWSHPAYRKALCSIPAYLMWDDHDITDGWGSRSDSFIDATSTEFRPEWKELFASARQCFKHMQSSRNPAPLVSGPEASFDFCFKVGRAGFIVVDLRSNRNARLGRLWSGEQLAAVRDWVAHHRGDVEVLFFVSPVVFTHGWPHMEHAIRKMAPWITTVTQTLARIPGVKRFRPVERFIKRNIQDVGGFRDDLEDAWASDPNNAQAEQALDFLFGLQNPTDGSEPLPVIILSGDIHAAGYSMVYSRKPEHRKAPVIEHVCSSPVASEPMHWLIEAMYHTTVKAVPIGTSGSYQGQVSHHHCQRNVVVLSLRRFAGDELQLKAKYYLEGRPQPEIVVSDLRRVSGWEGIEWGPQAARARQGRDAALKSETGPEAEVDPTSGR